MIGARTRVQRPHGLLFHFLDSINWAFERAQILLRISVLDVSASCFKFARSWIFYPPVRLKAYTQQLKEKPKRILRNSSLSFFDTFLCVNGVPSYVLAHSDPTYVGEEKEIDPKVKRGSSSAKRSSESVGVCCFSSDSSYLAICYVSGKITLWNTDQGTLVREESLEGCSVSSVSFLGEDNSVLLICTGNYTCWKWEMEPNCPGMTRICYRERASSIPGEVISQTSTFCNGGTKLVFSTIVACEHGPIVDVALVDITSDPLSVTFRHLSPFEVEGDLVISNAVLSPNGKSLLVSLMDQGFEDSFCLLWPNLDEHQPTCKQLDTGTIGSWSYDSKYVVTWIMTNRLNSNDEDETSAFIWNVEEMRENVYRSECSFENEKIKNPLGGNVFWCQVIQDVDKSDRLIMGVIGETTRFLFIDMASKAHTHTIETGISAKDMIFRNKEAWFQSYVAQRTVKGLSPMSVTKDGSMFGAVLGWPSEVIIWDVYLGVEILKVSPKKLQANQFRSGIDLMTSPSCTKFAIIGSNGVVVFCPSAPSKNEKRAKNCVETQMVQLDNPHISRDNLSNFKTNFSGDGDSIGVLSIGSPKMQVWNLAQGTSCTIESNAKNAEGAQIQDFCLSNNGKYLVIDIYRHVQIMACEAKGVAQMIGEINLDSNTVSMGINDDASEFVLCMEDGSIHLYERSYKDVYRDDENVPSTSNIHELAGQRLSCMERIKSWFKRPRVDVNEPLILDNGGKEEPNVQHTSIHIPSRTCLLTYTRHVLAGELDGASFEVSPVFENVFRFSESQIVEEWDLETKTELKDGVNDISFMKKSSCSYAHNSLISEQVNEELISKRFVLLNGTSIDLSRRTTLVQSSRENILVAGNSSSQGFKQRRDQTTFDIEVTVEEHEDSHSVYVINLEDVEYRRRLGGKELKPDKGLAISHDGRHVACLAGGFGSKVVVWNVYASARLLPDYNFLSLTLGDDIYRRNGVKRHIVPLIDEFGINFFMPMHPSGMSLLDETIYYCNNHLLRTILQYVLKQKIKVSFLKSKTSGRLLPTSHSHNAIEASIEGRSLHTLVIILKYLLKRVTHEVEVASILSSSLADILQVYPAIFVRTIEDPNIWGPGHEIEVRDQSVEGHKFAAWTDDSLDKSEKEARKSWTQEFGKHNEAKRDPLIANITFALPFRHACKIGGRGILRLLFINKAPSSVFGSFLVTSIVDYKWRKYAKNILIEELAYHCLVSICFTVYCFALISEGSNEEDSEHDAEEYSRLQKRALVLCCMVALPSLYREFCQCVAYLRKHKLPGFVYWLASAWNWIEVFSYLNMIIVIPWCQFAILKEESDRATLSALVAVESLLIWSRMLFYARPFNHTGPLVLTIEAIVNEILYFLVLAVSVMFGFALAFCVLYRHVKFTEDIATNDSVLGFADANQVDGVDDHAESMDKAFGTFKRSFFTVFGYTFGDFDFENQYHAPSPVTALTLFVLYVVSLAIILLNMLIALMSEKFGRIYENKKARLIEARARAIDDIDGMLSYKRRKELGSKIGKYLHVMMPAHNQDVLTKGSSPMKPQLKESDRTSKTQNRQILQELDRLLERSGLLRAKKPRRGLMTQDTINRSRPTMETIQESVTEPTSSHQGPMQHSDDIELEPYWHDSDSTESEFLNTYEDDSD